MDDWSLKGKTYALAIWQMNDGATFYDDAGVEDETEPLIYYTGKDGVVQTTYKKPDIETLRQKLIEDLEEFCNKYSDDFNAWSHEMHYESKKIINKRFGVDE